MPSRTSRLSSAITTRIRQASQIRRRTSNGVVERCRGRRYARLRAPPHGDDFSPDDGASPTRTEGSVVSHGSPRMRKRAPDWGGACSRPRLGCSWPWPRSSSAAPVTSRRRSAPASCPPARSSRPTPGACTAASRAPTRWPATASPTRWPTPTPPTRGSPRPARRRAAAVPRRAVHDQGVDRAARDAELRRPRRAARPPRRDDRAGGPAADRRGLHPARRDEHVGADDVDRVRQPRLRPHAQRLRPAAHGRRLVGRRGRGGRLGRLADRARLGHRAARSGVPAFFNGVFGHKPSPGLRAEHRPVPEHRRARRRSCSRSGRSPATPRT